MIQLNRVILIVLDSLGIGAAPDAYLYGDENSDTLGNIARSVEGFCLPKVNQLGLHYINEPYRDSCSLLPNQSDLIGSYGILRQKSVGKDTTTGHWELAGLILKEPFPVYPNGFPADVMDQFVSLTGKDFIGNYAASGTEIIESLGQEHMETGKLIVYTSADSVFQIAAHEEVIPLAELYHYCEQARKTLQGEHAVSRVIARPFQGVLGAFDRTPNRRDFSLPPPEDTILDRAVRSGLEVTGIGKISDIFAGRGITRSYKTKNNDEGVDRTIQCIQETSKGIIFTNLIDFDMLFGHRNNPEGYAEALVRFDGRLKEIMSAMSEDDLLMITADHGCDPTTASTDHTRELVPLLIYGKSIPTAVNIGTRDSFSDVAATIAEVFRLEYQCAGSSFLKIISTKRGRHLDTNN